MHERHDSPPGRAGAPPADDAPPDAKSGAPADERLLLLDDGWTAERVAEVLFIDAETVRGHRRLYHASGVAGLERLNYEGADPALNEEQLAALGAELDSRLYMTAKAVFI
ncbi:MAG: hypothetical protein ACLPKW_12640 [Acetobacteraceae bacterium]